MSIPLYIVKKEMKSITSFATFLSMLSHYIASLVSANGYDYIVLPDEVTAVFCTLDDSLHIRIDGIVADRQVGLGQNVLSRNFLYFHFICL